MGKQPTTGQKKSKDAILKAATQKKAGHKKWTKGKVKEKSNHAVFVDQATYDRMLQGIPKLGNHIGVSHVVEKFKVTGSIARMLLRTLVKDGSLGQNQKSSKQFMCYPKVQVAAKVTEVKKEEKKDKGGKKKQ